MTKKKKLLPAAPKCNWRTFAVRRKNPEPTPDSATNETDDWVRVGYLFQNNVLPEM